MPRAIIRTPASSPARSYLGKLIAELIIPGELFDLPSIPLIIHGEWTRWRSRDPLGETEIDPRQLGWNLHSRDGSSRCLQSARQASKEMPRSIGLISRADHKATPFSNPDRTCKGAHTRFRFFIGRLSGDKPTKADELRRRLRRAILMIFR
jgi:hypothetical protein